MNNSNSAQDIIETVQSFQAKDLGVGTSGNASIRTETGFLITPTGVDYHKLTENMIVDTRLDGSTEQGSLKPSSEWHFHAAIYEAFASVNAIVHVHSPNAVALACHRLAIPAFHYMVARAGGDNIPCAEYATFGTEQLAKNVVKALKNRKACLLANHGLIATGNRISDALSLAEEVEALARQYLLCKVAGEPVLLSEEEMRTNLEKFNSYGKQYE